MQRKKYLKIFLGIVSLMLMIKLLTIFFVEPWVGKKIEIKLNEESRNYQVKIDKVHILIISSGIELKKITISSKQEDIGNRELNGRIESIKFKGIKLAKAIFKKDICINEVTFSNSNIKGKIPFSGEAKTPIIAPSNIRIGSILFDKTEMEIESTSTKQSYSVKEGVLKMYDLQVEKQDTLSPGIVKQFDFHAEKLNSVSSDSMYSFSVRGIDYSASSNILAADSFSVHPNYNDYDFTSRYKYQTNRFEASLCNIYVYGFNAANYFLTKSLISSNIEIGKMDMKVFRDKRKEFRHINKPAFQDMIYNYPGTVNIDSIGLIKGNVTFTPHAEEANEPGSISFNKINAKIYKITNDTIYKKESAFLELKGNALLMGKGKMNVFLKGKIYDRHNTFSLNGSLSSLEANELNPILEKNTFIYATSGKIDAMNFSFTADNSKATGKMTILYHGLDIAVKNKRTDDTTAFIERLKSIIVNFTVLDSNPMPGKEVRVGIIDYERDPERFLFNYCFKSILSGIQSSLVKSPKKYFK